MKVRNERYCSAQHRNEKLKTEKLVGDKGSANCTPVLLIVSVTLARNRKTPFDP